MRTPQSLQNHVQCQSVAQAKLVEASRCQHDSEEEGGARCGPETRLGRCNVQVIVMHVNEGYCIMTIRCFTMNEVQASERETDGSLSANGRFTRLVVGRLEFTRVVVRRRSTYSPGSRLRLGTAIMYGRCKCHAETVRDTSDFVMISGRDMYS